MRPVCALIVGFALCLALLACGGSDKRAPARTASTPALVVSSAENTTRAVAPSKHVRFASGLPRSDGDADNPRDSDGNPDPDYHIDADEDTFTRASYGYPDGDEQWNFDYGKAATPAQARLIGGLLTRYYQAARAGDRSTGCALLLPSVARTVTPSLEEGSKRRPGETCDNAMTGIFEQLAYTFSGAIAITHVRVDGWRAEVVYGSPTMFASYIFFRRYGRTWKLEEPIPAHLG